MMSEPLGTHEDLIRCWNQSQLWTLVRHTLDGQIELAKTARFVTPPTKEELVAQVEEVKKLISDHRDCVTESFYAEQTGVLNSVMDRLREGDYDRARHELDKTSSFT